MNWAKVKLMDVARTLDTESLTGSPCKCDEIVAVLERELLPLLEAGQGCADRLNDWGRDLQARLMWDEAKERRIPITECPPGCIRCSGTAPCPRHAAWWKEAWKIRGGHDEKFILRGRGKSHK